MAAWDWRQRVTPGSGHHVLDVPDIVRETVDAHRLAQLQQTGDDRLNGHSLLYRLNVTAALAPLDSRTRVTDEDWTLAGVMMAVSTHTRASCRAPCPRPHESQRGARSAPRQDIVLPRPSSRGSVALTSPRPYAETRTVT
jgi:hypothetical protein